MENIKEQLKGIEGTFDFANMNYTMPDMTGNLEEIDTKNCIKRCICIRNGNRF